MKYLEYFNGNFPSDIEERRAIDKWPYVGYSDEGVVYTVIPKPSLPPPDNEIWYTTSNGNIVEPQYLNNFGAGFVENIYEDGKGILRFNGPVTYIPGENSSRVVGSNDAGAFRGCQSLTSIIIPNSVASIGGNAFSYCESLTSVTISNNVKSLWDCAFEECRSLVSIVIPDNVTTIGNGCFKYCSGLVSVIIGRNVAYIGYQAFNDCSSLTSITFKGTVQEWDNITKESYWNSNVPATYVQCSDGQVTL